MLLERLKGAKLTRELGNTGNRDILVGRKVLFQERERVSFHCFIRSALDDLVGNCVENVGSGKQTFPGSVRDFVPCHIAACLSR